MASIVLSVEKKSDTTALSSKTLKGILTKMWIITIIIYATLYRSKIVQDYSQSKQS